MSINDDNNILRCSFCGKPQNMYNRLIAGNGCYICEECINMCANIMAENPMDDELENDELYEKEYNSFVSTMCYGDTIISFADAMQSYKKLCDIITNS